MLDEISIVLKNVPGELSRALIALEEEYVNVLAFSIDQHGKDSTIRLLCDSPEKARKQFEDFKFSPEVGKVLAVRMEHKPGALKQISNALYRDEINIEYAYLTLIPLSEDAIVILKLNKERTIGQYETMFARYGKVITDVKEFKRNL